MNKSWLLLLILAFLASCNAECSAEAFLDGQFSRCQTLDENYDVFWNVNSEANELTLALHLRQYPNGWVGIGTSVNGGMRGADIAIARLVKGNYTLEDRFVPGVESEPKIDDHQDLTLISATSDDTALTVIFKRKLIPCDVDEDVAIQQHETPIIFAYGKSFGYHGQSRGSTMIYFHYIPAVPDLPKDTQIIQLLMPPYHVPSKDTTYTCTPVEFPHDRKYHIVRWRPVIPAASKPYVHHMVVFQCPSLIDTVPYECGMAPVGCTGLVLGWGPGFIGNDWFGDYALPIGGDDGIYFGMLQIHYNNPTEVAGIVDNSGFEIYYTPTLRPIDIQ